MLLRPVMICVLVIIPGRDRERMAKRHEVALVGLHDDREISLLLFLVVDRVRGNLHDPAV